MFFRQMFTALALCLFGSSVLAASPLAGVPAAASASDSLTAGAAGAGDAESWALLAAGFAAVGFIILRRKSD
jgi:hypothetical protein